MKSSRLKELFNEIAQKNDFKSAFGGWFKESTECVVTLDLQKSKFGNYYDLNIKTYIQGVFGTQYSTNKYLIKNDTGDIFTRQPVEFNNVFDLDDPMEENIRKDKLEILFRDFIVPNTNTNLTRAGIKAHSLRDSDFLLPAIKKELQRFEKLEPTDRKNS